MREDTDSPLLWQLEGRVGVVAASIFFPFVLWGRYHEGHSYVRWPGGGCSLLSKICVTSQ